VYILENILPVKKTGCESEFSVDKVGDGGTEVASHTALAFQTDPAIK